MMKDMIISPGMSTPAATTTTRMTRNMAVQRSRRANDMAHTAWRRNLIRAVSVAATLCCCFIPGALSPPPSKALASKDVEREVGARPKTDFVRKSISELKLKDFDKLANRLLCHIGFKPPDNGRFTPSRAEKTPHTVFTRDDDLARVFEERFKRGWAPISFSKHDDYWEKPSDIPDDVETWVQGSVRSSIEGAIFEIKLTMHPNVKPDEPEGVVISFHGFYTTNGWNAKLEQKYLQMKVKQPEKRRVMSKCLFDGDPDQNILDYTSEDDLFLCAQPDSLKVL